MYDYTRERGFVFTEDGITMLFKIRDKARELLQVSGAFREQELHSQVNGDGWSKLTCVDYLIERGEIIRVYDKTVRQHNVYVKGGGSL